MGNTEQFKMFLNSIWFTHVDNVKGMLGIRNQHNLWRDNSMNAKLVLSLAGLNSLHGVLILRYLFAASPLRKLRTLSLTTVMMGLLMNRAGLQTES